MRVVEINAVKPQNGNANGLAGDIMGYNCIHTYNRAVLDKTQFQIIFSKRHGGDCLDLESTQFFLHSMTM